MAPSDDIGVRGGVGLIVSKLGEISLVNNDVIPDSIITNEDWSVVWALLMGEHVFTESQINGANGEATGSDDLDNVPTSKVGDRLRKSSGIDAGLTQLEGVSSRSKAVSTKSEDCKWWAKGKCTRERCRFNHRPEMKFCDTAQAESKLPDASGSAETSTKEDRPDKPKVAIDPFNLANVVIGSVPLASTRDVDMFVIPMKITLVFMIVMVACAPLPMVCRHNDVLYDFMSRNSCYFHDMRKRGYWDLLLAEFIVCYMMVYVAYRHLVRLRTPAFVELVHRQYNSTARYIGFRWFGGVMSLKPDPADFLARRGLTHDSMVTCHEGLVTFLVKKYRRSNIEAHLPNSWYKSIEEYVEVLDIDVVNNSVRRAHQILHSYHAQDVANGLYSGRAAVPVGRPN